MKFKKAILSSLFLFFLTVAYLAYYSLYVMPKDLKKYEELMKKNKNLGEQKTTMQFRENVQKDVWQEGDETRLHHRIFAKNSALLLTTKNGKLHMKDYMENITCLVQENFFTLLESPMQELRHFEAESGIYDFDKHEFVAEKVLLSFINAKGFDLPKKELLNKPFLKGVAKEVSFSFSKKGPAFHAEKFKAEMIPEEKL